MHTDIGTRPVNAKKSIDQRDRVRPTGLLDGKSISVAQLQIRK
jgi:hypothetical protein